MLGHIIQCLWFCLCACSDRDDFIAECEKIRPLNTYHSGSGDPVHLQHEPHAANGSHSSSLQAADSSPLGSSGYQQYLRQQQQLLAPPHQQQQQDHQLPLDSWAGLMSESTMNNLEDMLRASGGSSVSGSSSGSRPRRSSPGNWDEDWEGPLITSDDDNGRGRGRGRLLARLSDWLARRQKNKQRKLRQHMSEAEQLKVELELLHRADLQEQQQEHTDRKDRRGGSWP